MSGPWIGVDLDGTLSEYHEWGKGEVGRPIQPMVERLKGWLGEGKNVRIMTARVGIQEDAYSEESGSAATKEFADRQRTLIEDWCLEHVGQKLPVTATKDFEMVELWDDRAVVVEPNTGRIIGYPGGPAFEDLVTALFGYQWFVEWAQDVLTRGLRKGPINLVVQNVLGRIRKPLKMPLEKSRKVLEDLVRRGL